jgi:hypothetical protein
VNKPSVARHLDRHDVHLALSGEPVRKDAISTSCLAHPNCKIKDRGPARFIVLSHVVCPEKGRVEQEYSPNNIGARRNRAARKNKALCGERLYSPQVLVA